jgi:hypothetical protein
MDLDNFIIGKTKERRGLAKKHRSSSRGEERRSVVEVVGLRQFHHRQFKT